MAFRLGAGGTCDPGRLDRAAARRTASGDAAANVNSYGTTLRVYDPDIDAWRIQWTDPVTRSFLQMIGRAEGDDIVQLGTRPDGTIDALELFGDHAGLVPLARRNLRRPWRELADQVEFTARRVV